MKSKFFSSTTLHALRLSRVLPLLVLICFLSSASANPLLPGLPENGTDSEAAPPEKTTKKSSKTLTGLSPKVTDLQMKLLDMRSDLKGIEDTESIEENLLTLSENKNQLQEQFHSLKTDPQANVQNLSDLQDLLQKTDRDASKAADDLDGYIAIVTKWISYWSSEKDDLALWEEGVAPVEKVVQVQDLLTDLRETIAKAEENLDSRLVPLLELQKKAGALQVSVHALALEINELFLERYQRGISQQDPPFFSKVFWGRLNSSLFQQAKRGILLSLNPDMHFLEKRKVEITVSVVVFFLLFAFFYSSRSYLEKRVRYSFIQSRPAAVAMYISLIIFFLIVGKTPHFWTVILRFLSLLIFMRIARVVVADKIQKNAFTRIILLLLITDFFILSNMPTPLIRLYVFAVSSGLMLFYILQLVRKKKELAVKWPWLLWGYRLGICVFIIILLAEIEGQAELAFYIFVAALKSFYHCLMLWLIYLITMAILELVLFYLPLPMLRKNSKSIITMLQPVISFVCLTLLILLVLTNWRAFPSVNDAYTYLGDLGLTIGDRRLSLGIILTSSFLLYVSYSLSRLVQAVLLESVLPRHNVEKGIQLSMTRLLHYGIMLIGFLTALSVLGFSMTNLTILGGALGVGIGFGLQEIVKNFAGGLILLFERPIKVGDTIQVGQELAEVKELGLRATIVQTFDNAEVVVPNSDLITGQVTNWTLGERKVRLRLPVGVAYGSDVEKVLEILLTTAKEHPEILSTPPPNALFMAFGASSLDFELRVFIPEFTNRRRVQSELNITINREFADNDIEIPFPQNDLHLRSVDQEAAQALIGRPVT